MIGSRSDLIEEALAQMEALASFRRQAYCAQPLHREVSLPQVHILITLQERGSMTLSELAHLLDISAPSASSIVDRMEERELVERLRDTFDRRVVHVQISEHGREVVENVVGLKRDHMQRLLDAMTDSELRDMTRGLVAVRNALSRTQRLPR